MRKALDKTVSGITRMPVANRRAAVSFSLRRDQVEKLTSNAIARGLNRSEYLRELIEAGFAAEEKTHAS